jgi:uncharacterized membrane protein
VFFVIDIIWLAFVARTLYKQELGFIMSPKPNWVAAMIFYTIFVAGLVYFVIYQGIQESDLLRTLLNGLAFGFVTYSTYDLTNLATLKDWPIKITVIDLCWGTVLGGTVSVLTYGLYNLLF